MAITLTIRSRSGREIGFLELDPSETVKELKKKFHGANKKYYPGRQRFELPVVEGEKRGVALADDSKTLASYGLTKDTTLTFKDLGTQIDYATVFFWEYLGPLLIYPMFYSFPNIFYPWYKEKRQPALVQILAMYYWSFHYARHIAEFLRPRPLERQHALVQTLAMYYWSFHYAKRIAETFFVHNFGHATMPIFNLFKNCSYYWGFAAFVSYFVNHPLFTPPTELQSQVCLGLAMLFQASNFWCHIILANLRKPGEQGYKIPTVFLSPAPQHVKCHIILANLMKPGEKENEIPTFFLSPAPLHVKKPGEQGYKIPTGFLFNYISCANYTCEIMGWVFFTLATQALPALLFTAAGGFQMAQWAMQKHARLRKTFDGKEGRAKYPRRWIMLPPFL
eukprot:gene24166-9753_t